MTAEHDVERMEISRVAKNNVKQFIRAVESMKPRRAGRSTKTTITQADNGVMLEFRVPFSDHKHPSSIKVNAEAENASEVFQTGKYQTIRFESLGRDSFNTERARHKYGQDLSEEELVEKNQEDIEKRKEIFKSKIAEVAEQYSGISVRVDTGDAAFSNGYYRPHVRLVRVNTSGGELALFVQDCVDALDKNLYEPSPFAL